jgi:DNA-binding Xre family transcriptional regulator
LYFSILICTINTSTLVSLNLTPIFKARGIDRPYTFLVKAGLSPHSTNAILNSKTRIFRLDHIELLCRVLVCEPNDLVVFTAVNNQHLYPDHPLNNLKQTETAKDIKETLATIPFKQLKEITKQINGVL